MRLLQNVRHTAGLLLGSAYLALSVPAHAAGSGMPWEEPLQQVLESVQGPVAKIVAVISPDRRCCTRKAAARPPSGFRLISATWAIC